MYNPAGLVALWTRCRRRDKDEDATKAEHTERHYGSGAAGETPPDSGGWCTMSGCAQRDLYVRSGRSEMSELQEAAELLSRLRPAEKAQLLQWVVRDLGDAFPGVESTAGVCGGEPCIVRTRIPVWLLEQARRLGTSEADLLRCYPTLRAEDLANAWAYVRAHRDEIEEQIRLNEEA